MTLAISFKPNCLACRIRWSLAFFLAKAKMIMKSNTIIGYCIGQGHLPLSSCANLLFSFAELLTITLVSSISCNIRGRIPFLRLGLTKPMPPGEKLTFPRNFSKCWGGNFQTGASQGKWLAKRPVTHMINDAAKTSRVAIIVGHDDGRIKALKVKDYNCDQPKI